MRRARQAPLRAIEPVAGHLAAAGLVDLFAGHAGGNPGLIQIAADRLVNERQLLFTLREQDVFGLRKIFAQGFLIAAQVSTGRLAPYDVVEQAEMPADGQFHLRGQVGTGEQVERSGRVTALSAFRLYRKPGYSSQKRAC